MLDNLLYFLHLVYHNLYLSLHLPTSLQTIYLVHHVDHLEPS